MRTAVAAMPADLPADYSRYVSYFAGVDMLAVDKTLSARQKIERYKRLCLVTGIDGPKARVMINRYKNDPAGWQQFRAAVLTVLEKRR